MQKIFCATFNSQVVLLDHWFEDKKGGFKMLETIAIILIILWLLGFITSYTMGGFIHILLVIAVVVILVRVIQGRRL